MRLRPIPFVALLLLCQFVNAGLPAQRQLTLPEFSYDYTSTPQPEYFEAAGVENFDTTPKSNPTTNAGATLGRVLFYDVNLSANSSTSCASCHQQSHAFSDPRQFSIGFDGQQTDRNSMSAGELKFVRAGFFWDERATTLEDAVLIPLFSHVEMGLNEEMLIERIQQDERYTSLFKNAFDSEDVTSERVSQALAQFLRSIESYNSRYDLAATKGNHSTDDFPDFTASENLGKRLFYDKCAACHHLGTAPQNAIFAMFRSLNNGIDPSGTVRDGGRGDITFDPSEIGSFKASSLRNIEHTAPYMHDGRLATLEDVIEHYSTGVNRHPNLGPVVRFQFSKEESQALVDFLKTLSDTKLLTDVRFSNPWSTETEPTFSETSDVTTVTRTGNRTIDEIQQRLNRGEGLSLDETTRWLMSLDTDESGTLSAAKLEPAIDIIRRTDIFTQRSRTRAAAARVGRTAPGGPRAAGAPQPPVDQPALPNQSDAIAPQVMGVGDFDGDGDVSEKEAADYESLSRFIELAGGGRLEVFLDRVLGRFPLNGSQLQSARTFLSESRYSLIDEARQMDQELHRKLQETLTPEEFNRFQRQLVDGLRQANPTASNPPISREDALTEIWKYDLNQDSTFTPDEIALLAKRLATVAGGFGQLAGSGADVAMFSTRIFLYDANQDGAISPDELPERMRCFAIDGDANHDGFLSVEESNEQLQRAAFDRIVETGIYIGGGFANAFSTASKTLRELNLSQETTEKCEVMIQEHLARIKQRTDETTQLCFAHLQHVLSSSVAQ
ncbi:cytochrome c peroxidase [Planctomicrobium sp. SH668]|uniref:cytochrome c peroxidase n=1 Tax=Planctomicrobium sp. SH668 TaxID=3448126 RepID=UPI003F5C6701